MKVDLHTHTNFSDGNLTIDNILALSSKLEIKEIAITDHDTIINLSNYKELTKKHNVEIIPGIEMATNVSGMHILGYGITNFEIVETQLYNLKKYNEEQNRKTIKSLQNNGIKISYQDVLKIANSNVITYRDIVKFLVEKKYVLNWREAYQKYIGKNTKSYFPSLNLSIEEVLEIIRKGNGISVLAHPFTLDSELDFDSIINLMINLGLDGIEVCSKKLSNQQSIFLNYIADKYNLIKTFGTDFHDFSTDKLGVEIEEKFIEKFNSKVLKKVLK